MKRPATIYFKCPKCGSTEVRNLRSGSVNAYACYGCGHKWGDGCDTLERQKARKRRLLVAVWWILLFCLIIEGILTWINTL